LLAGPEADRAGDRAQDDEYREVNTSFGAAPADSIRSGQASRILSTLEQGDSLDSERLLPLVFGELRELTASRMNEITRIARKRPGPQFPGGVGRRNTHWLLETIELACCGVSDAMKERDIFVAALAITHLEERDAFLDDACSEPGQKERLRALLEEEAKLGAFLESPARAAEPAWVDEAPGTVIGSYKLLEQIGEGGMGVVFMAEQTRAVRRRVALKVIKPGMDTRQVIARFEAERQALALMEHPNIARVLDAGTTDSARPYFVMELVRGVPITDYCDKNRLDPAARLRLFATVCLAIQHAHQKGIIHRDIKPSNVMVTLNDGQPVAKVIDFGIAKATAQRLTERTLFTAYGEMIGTPAYMSPEQAEMASVDVDTRSDIYSLGVLLYELMTGTTPIEDARLRTAAIGEIQRLIREVTPPRPSSRLSTLGQSATVLAGNRGTDPKRLAKLLAGDLDWIMMKALEKDRNRRYATAGDFAADIERFLQHEAVVARPPSAAYRLSTFVRRHRGVVMAGTAAVMTLLAGAGVATWQAVVANQAKRTAQAKEAETQAVLDFVQDRIFAAARPLGQANGLGKDVTLQSTLTAAIPYVDGSFADQPLVEARLRETLGRSFLYLGEARMAADQIERARDILTRILGPADIRTLKSANALADSYRAQGRLDEALELSRRTLERRRDLLGPDHPDTLESMSTLAKVYGDYGRHAEALKLREAALAGYRARLGPNRLETITSMMNLANSYAGLGRLREALELDEQALATAKSTFGPDHPDVLPLRNNLALDYAGERRYEDALELHQETLAICKDKLGPAHPTTLMSMHNVAKALSDLKRYEEALKVLQEVFDFQKVKTGPEHPETIHTMYSIGNQLGWLKRYAEALEWHRQAFTLRKAKLGPDNRETLYSMWGMGLNLLRLGRASEALPIIDECLRRAAAHPTADFSGLADRRLDYCAESSDAQGCRKTAEIWESMRRTDAASLYNAARYRAVAAAVLRKSEHAPHGNTRADKESDQAMTWLRQAVAAGFNDKDRLAKSKEFDSMRDRADFRRFMAELEAKQH
jgi:eukaryotic-like serine/threonine-protein kinase